MDEQETKEVIKELGKTETAAKAQAKLALKSLVVDVSRNLKGIEVLEAAVTELKTTHPEKADDITKAENQITEWKNDTISAIFVPLRSTDKLMIQGLIAETATKGQEMNFDLATQLYVIGRAEDYGTVYFALRKKNNLNERYFKTQDELIELNDRTLMELARLYRDAFVLTNDERKNS